MAKYNQVLLLVSLNRFLSREPVGVGVFVLPDELVVFYPFRCHEDGILLIVDPAVDGIR